jgi:hypothetical protein
MLVLGDFLIFAPVVGFVLQVVLAEQVGSQDEVVAQIDVADFGQAGVLGDKSSGGTLVPGQAGKLGQVLLFLETKDVDDLGQDASGDDCPQALDGDDGIGNGVNVASDVPVETFHGAVKIVDVIPHCSQGGGDHLVHARVDGVGRAQGLANSTRCGGRVCKSPLATAGDQVDQLVMSHLLQLGNGELGEQGGAGGAQDVGEGFDPFPVAGFEEGVGLEAHLLLGQGLGETVAVAGQPAQPLPEIARHVGDRQFTETDPGGDVEGIPIVVLGAAQHQAVLELGHELGIEADQFQLEGLQERLGAQVAVEGDPQHTGRFPADLDAGVAQFRGYPGDGGRGRLGTWQVVGHAEAFEHLVTQGLVHRSQNDLVLVDIGSDTERWLVLRFVHHTTPLGNVTRRPEWVSQGTEQGNNLVYQNSGGRPAPHGNSMRV